MEIRRKVRQPNMLGAAALGFDINGTYAGASVLLRVIALRALTEDEVLFGIDAYNSQANEELRLIPTNDILFLFRPNIPQQGNNRALDRLRLPANLELTIPNNEFIRRVNYIPGLMAMHLGQVNAAITTAAAAAQARPIALTAPALRGFLNNLVAQPQWPAIPPNEVLTPAALTESYGIMIPNPPNAPLNFLQEVKAAHNLYKKIARYNYCTLQVPLPIGVATTPPFEPTTTITTQRWTGNFGSMEVISIGAYGLSTRNPLRATLIGFRNYFTSRRGVRTDNPVAANIVPGINQAINNPVPAVSLERYYRDLFRLECVREPAALLTGAMFFELAEPQGALNQPYESIRRNPIFYMVYRFERISEQMPMAPTGSVNSSRSLWASLLRRPLAAEQIYYQYDYTSSVVGGEDLAQRERDILFDWVMRASGLTEDIREILDAQNLYLQQTVIFLQQARAMNPLPWINVFGNTWRVNINGYIIRCVIGGHNLTSSRVLIESFPLDSINQLIQDWYGINLALIGQVNLALRGSGEPQDPNVDHDDPFSKSLLRKRTQQEMQEQISNLELLGAKQSLNIGKLSKKQQIILRSRKEKAANLAKILRNLIDIQQEDEESNIGGITDKIQEEFINTVKQIKTDT